MRLSVALLLGVAMTSTIAAQQAGGTRGGGQPTEPRIVTFEARPASVRPGESVLLVWATENPSGITIDPEVGAASARGTKQVRPAVTTTYTLAMRNGPSKTVTVTVAGTAAPNSPDSSANKPDLSGVYSFAGLPAGTKAPDVKPGAEKFVIVRGPNEVRGRTTLGPDCKPLGIPQTYITPYPFQIVQTAKLIVQLFEYPNAIRMIPLDGRPHPVDPDPTWMGNAVGRWDGDTLVVDSVGFNDKTEVHGFMHTESLHVIERFKRLDNGNLQYDVTVEDPNVWVTPWVIPARTFTRRTETEWVEEFVCESNVDYNKLFKK